MTTQPVIIAQHGFAFGYHRQVWWNWLIGSAFFCGGIGASLFILSLLTRYRPGMLLGYTIVVVGKNTAHLMYLGRPERFWRAAARPDRSWIARGIWATGLFAASGLVLLLSAFVAPRLVPERVNLIAGGVAIVSGLFIMFYDGFVMNHSPAIPFWNTKLLPLLILMYAALGGTTLSITMRMLQSYSRPEMRWMERAELYLLLANSAILAVYLLRMSRWSPAAQATARMWVKGSYARVFFGLIVALGLLVTLALSLVQQQAQACGLALVIAGCELAGDFSLLMLMLRSGLFAPQTAPAFAARAH
jgi:sulfite dehydrogenase (quinone) subunit SoeC